MEYEQVKNAETPEGMRAEIFRLQHYDPLVRNVMEMANYTGMSAEDRYTVLAYNALKQLNALMQHTLENVRIFPSPITIATSIPSSTNPATPPSD